MLITVPTSDDSGLKADVAPHFGRAAYFTTVDTESEEVQVRPNQGHHFGGSRGPAAALTEAKTDAIVCSSLGIKALQRFRDAGIEVYTGAEGTVSDALADLRSQRLPLASDENACPGRHGNGQGTG